ncbi:MAG: outer membrane beta-barrel domain-containing protein [Deltaproteobacteria bacterium]|nr:outer membrane beta-barrel domain-containing protein [Candidatus Latescibacterota bacterium]MCB9728968.1 outer membrane beta-barrel domain-containing protein [Deltaproteobacteria bacterium]MCB9786514.1 outer membrane beta-barrel domain-containing protein [Deltaproteobacteria bacterium]
MSSALRASIVAIALLVVAPTVRAKGPLDGLPPIRNQVLLEDGRHVLAPIVGSTINDAFNRNIMVGLSWRYFFQNWVGIGLDVLGGFGVDTKLADRINRELSTEAQPFSLSKTTLDLLANATLEFVPIDGKFMLFGKFQARIDLHLQLGLGIALVGGDGRIQAKTALMPVVGAGIRFYPTNWFAIGAECRDYIVDRTVAARGDGSIPPSEFGHNWFIGLALSFFLPVEPAIRP